MVVFLRIVQRPGRSGVLSLRQMPVPIDHLNGVRACTHEGSRDGVRIVRPLTRWVGRKYLGRRLDSGVRSLLVGLQVSLFSDQ